MKFFLLITVIGFVQLCSSASIATTSEPVTEVTSKNSSNSTTTYDEIIEEFKGIPGANIQWVVDVMNSIQKMDLHNPYSVALDGMAHLFSTLFDVDFVKMNRTFHQHMRDNYGCGVDFSMENQTFSDCFRGYAESLKNKSAEEIKSIREQNCIKFQNTFSKEIEVSKITKIIYVVRTISDPNTTDSEEGTSKFIDILVSLIHDGARISKRDACDIVLKGYKRNFDCTKYESDEVKSYGDNIISPS